MSEIKPQHPCFDKESKHKHARVHLPVAPKCNIQCNYCNRKYDCVNESRPGVTSAVLSPFQAVHYLKALHKELDNISVIGIAGPGDPFATPELTLQTLRLVKESFPEKIFCLSSNGLNVAPYVDELAELNVTHVTLTVNAVDPAISEKIYPWVRHGKVIYRNRQAAQVLYEQQMKALVLLKEKGITVKINTIILPGVNDHHIPAVARMVKSLGADVMNCIPVVPNSDTGFSTMSEPDAAMVFRTRTLAKEHIDIMSHCARCRADAAGLLGQDMEGAFGLLQEYANMMPGNPKERPHVAVATHEGLLVNQHLGEAGTLSIYRETPNGFKWIEHRATPKPGAGDFRWMELGNSLADCRALLVSGVGNKPLEILQNTGVRVIQMTGLIDEGLEAVYQNKTLRTIKKPDAFKCGDTCRGNAQGCG
jgi:nitrogen fixation protein NifB